MSCPVLSEGAVRLRCFLLLLVSCRKEGRKWVPKLPGAVQCSDLGFNRLRPAERHRKAPSCIQSGNYLALVLRDCLHFIYLVASALHCIALHSHEGILVRSPTHNPSA
ncbi:hypothetical protein KC19_3G119600 [Ceratodon purpureus]|uniref:Uncharacterized protein n=1 Tax=Ceratodon purpureus TaxID=3225 RepID=A0A8T0IJV2_CERPU|nr:hypothetical protein KC19_3G119600 [Ceratodon purpureus]